MAAQAMREGDNRKAVEYYRLALKEYLDGTQTAVVLVNAAATCFNLGALSKKLQQYKGAAAYFVQAQEMYDRCIRAVRMAGNQVYGTETSCEVCLYQLIVETLHARAHLHYKHQKSIDDAINCHEEVLRILEHQVSHDSELVTYRVKFVRLSEKERRTLLIRSLQSLGKLYVERGDIEDGLIAYQQTLAVIREFGSENADTRMRQDELAQIIKRLSSMNTKKPTTNVSQLERLARMEEDAQRWEQAIACWERVLYLESQEHGEESSPVADALCQIARVMTLEGNGEGALDLYNAAFKKYQQTKTRLPREAVGNTTNIFCQLQLHDEALNYLDGLVKHAHTTQEKAWILCQRGRIYLEQGLLQEARETLCQSAQMFDSADDYVFKLLQKVEFLQQRANGVYAVHATTSLTKVPLDSIIEDDENSTMSADTSQLGARSFGPSALWARRGGQTILKTVDEQRQEDVATPTTDEVPIIERATSDVRSTRRVMPMGSGEGSPTAGNDEIPSDEDSCTDGTPSDESHGGSGREAIPHSKSPSLSRARIVTPPRIPNRDGYCVDARGGVPPTDYESVQQPCVPSPPVSSQTQMGDSGFEGSLYISSDEESEECDEAQREMHSDSTPATVTNVIDIGEEQLLDESGAHNLQGVDVDKESTNTLPSFPSSRNLSMPSLSSSQVLKNPKVRSNGHQSEDMHEAIEVDLAQQRDDRDKVAAPLEYIQDRSAPTSPASSSPKADHVPKSQVARLLSNRSRLVMALSNPFRRARSKKSVVPGTLGALDEEKEVHEFNVDSLQIREDASASFDDAPVSYIAMRKRSVDDGNDDDESLVSQITFKWDESKPQKSSMDHQWWWGVTAEGLEGWFPTSYVHQAVEAAEGFLSARAIHEKVNSRPLDFESDEESDISGSKGEHTSSGDQVQIEPHSSKKDKPDNDQGTEDEVYKEGSLQSPDGIDRATESRGSSASRKTALAFQIEEKQAHLEDQSTMGEIGDSTTAIILFELASLQSKNGEFGEAIKNLQHALELQKADNNIHDACRTLQMMADINSRAKYYKAALSCYDEARQLQEDFNGYYNEEVANILNRQGNVFARQGEFDSAMENHKEALRILKECCGEEVKNPLVSQTLIQIGAVYYRERNSLKTIQKNHDGYTTFIESGMLEVIGRAHEDRGSYRMAIAFFEEKLQCLNNESKAEDRKQIAETLNSLGLLSCRAGLYLEAMEYYDQAQGIQNELGCDDMQVAMAKVLCASVQYFLGHFQKALKLLETGLQSMRAKAGMEQETVAATLFHIGVVHVALGNFSVGMSNLREAIKIQTKLLGSEHPATLRTRREIANLLVSWESNIDLALEEYNTVIEIQRRIHGPKHPNIAETLHFIGCAEARKGNKELALTTLESCYNMRLGFLGSDHPLQATTLHKIAEIRLQKGRVKKALHICDSALMIRKESLSENHVDVAGLLATKASCLVARANYADANKLFLEALAIIKESVGTNHPAFADLQVQMGAMHLRTCHFEEATTATSMALDVYRKAGLNEDHPAIKGALDELEKVERAEMLCV